MDYEKARSGDYAGALAALTEKGLLTPGEREGIRMDWLRGFFSSSLGRRALAAREAHREWAFNLSEGQSLIQGVIDLCFWEEDGWVLVDYKTDLAGEDALRARYTFQLQWYAKALARITGRPVKEAALFSLRNGQAYGVAPMG